MGPSQSADAWAKVARSLADFDQSMGLLLNDDRLLAMRRLADEMLALDAPAPYAMLANGMIDEVE